MSETDLLKKDIEYIQKDIKSINGHITNHIPTQNGELGGRICELKKSFNDFRINQMKWQSGILVSIVLMLLAILFK